jgi:hypothetical protein
LGLPFSAAGSIIFASNGTGVPVRYIGCPVNVNHEAALSLVVLFPNHRALPYSGSGRATVNIGLAKPVWGLCVVLVDS